MLPVSITVPVDMVIITVVDDCVEDSNVMLTLVSSTVAIVDSTVSKKKMK